MVAEWALRLRRRSESAFGEFPRLGMMPKLTQYQRVASIPVIAYNWKLVILRAKAVRKNIERVVVFTGDALL